MVKYMYVSCNGGPRWSKVCHGVSWCYNCSVTCCYGGVTCCYGGVQCCDERVGCFIVDLDVA